MRISQLSEATGMPIATLKFYLRERVLHPGELRAKTQADYDETHVDQVKFVRALTDVGGLSIAATRDVIEAMGDPTLDRLNLMAAAHTAMLPDAAPPRTEHPLACALLDELDWIYDPQDPLMDLLERQLEVAHDADIAGDDSGRNLARMAHRIAEADLELVPQEPQEAVRKVVLGTLLSDKLLITLRRLAQIDVAVRTYRPDGEQPDDRVDAESIST